MVRRFFRDSVIYFIPSALSSGMSFFVFPLYAHHFSPKQYGAFDLVSLTAMLVGWTVALEIYQGVGIYVAGETDRAKVRSYASTALWFAVCAYALFAGLVELFATGVSRGVLGSGSHVALIRVAVPWMALQGILAIVQAQLRWQLRPVAFVAGAVLNAVVTVVMSVVLVFAAHLEVEGAILGQLIGTAVGLAYALIATRRTFGFTFNWRHCREMLSYSIPMVPSSVGVFMSLYADRLVIQHVKSLYDVGLYGVGYRLAMIATLLLTGFQAAGVPLILARKDEPSTPDDLERVFRIFTALALCMFLALSVLAPPALHVLAAPRYQSAASIVPLLVASVMFANMYVFTPGLAIKKKTVWMAAVTVAAGVANLVLALILTPPLGIKGAAIATAVTSAWWFAALMAVSQTLYYVPHRWRQLLVALLADVAIVVVGAELPSLHGMAPLGATALVVRLVVVVVGSAVVTRLALGREETRGLTRRASSLLRGPGRLASPAESS